MRAGKLRHRISFNKTNEARNTHGEMVQTDSATFYAWSEIKPKSGGNNFIAKQHTEKTTHEITVRYNSQIKAELTINYGSRKFEIENIINSFERNRELILICKEFS